eukprot:Mycagemm_TRINITY_DN11746_c0_g1::TRINITY_DN11746_c0_g1_i1::g.1712::m.1712 type:complete len:101 gc:universal TRINITY_DN11746_c0_g1_i1:300-602(+)
MRLSNCKTASTLRYCAWEKLAKSNKLSKSKRCFINRFNLLMIKSSKIHKLLKNKLYTSALRLFYNFTRLRFLSTQYTKNEQQKTFPFRWNGTDLPCTFCP